MRGPAVVFIAASLAATGFAAGRLLPGPATSAAQADAASGRRQRWQCPMHPSVTSDHAGTTPCCGMPFEPVRDAAGGTHAAATRPPGTVQVDYGRRQLQGVRVAAVESGAVIHPLRLFGRVVPEENRVYSLNAAMEGSIRDVASVTTGALVRRDQRLGAFFSADMRAALQAYITALDVQDRDPNGPAAHLVSASGSTPNRSASYTVERLRGMGMSIRQIDEMRVRREVPLLIDITSPTDGVVLSRGITPGQKFDKGAEWFRVANLDRVWILADVIESDVALARPGATAQVTIPGRPGALVATVSAVPPVFDAASRTHKVRLEVTNPGLLLRPDMWVDVELQVEHPAAITVPVDAVVDSGLRRTVFVEAADGAFEPRPVETGWRGAGRVEIRSGLSAGERIVVSGTFLVDSESQIRAAAEPRPARAAVDPVCGMDVDPARAREAGRTVEHDGRTHVFCSDSCKASFLAAHGTGATPARVAGRP